MRFRNCLKILISDVALNLIAIKRLCLTETLDPSVTLIHFEIMYNSLLCFPKRSNIFPRHPANLPIRLNIITFNDQFFAKINLTKYNLETQRIAIHDKDTASSFLLLISTDLHIRKWKKIQRSKNCTLVPQISYPGMYVSRTSKPVAGISVVAIALVCARRMKGV